MILKDENIICLSSSQWDSPTWVNPQHLMSRFAGSNRILYVEPISLRFPSIRKTDMTKIVYRVRGWFRGVRYVTDSLLVYSPVLIPLHQFKSIRMLNRLLLKSSLKIIQKRYCMYKPILWIFLPTGVELLDTLGEKLIIYHCVDQYSKNPGVDQESIDRFEKKLLKRANLVFTTAESLYQAKKRFNNNTFYFPNVADVVHFKKTIQDVTEVSDDLRMIPSPVAGFWGAISRYKLDFELLRFAAEKLPEVSFVFIGPVGSGDPNTDVSDLRKIKNIYLLGSRSYHQLPNYAKGFDACLIPFKLNETTRHVFPMKFFEYMSSGKPVVSTALPSLKNYASYCYLAPDPEAFVKMLRLAINEKNVNLQAKRIRLAENNSWENRISELSSVILKRI